MTDQFRACCVCFRQWVSAPGEVKCEDCSPGRAIPNNTATKRPRPKPVDLSQGLPENLAGYSIEDFLPPKGQP